jgi:transcriptional regulator with XRE-family HTH domain
MSPTQFGIALKLLRLSQTGFANRVGVTRRQVFRWATGATEVPLSIEIIVRLLVLKKITLDDLDIRHEGLSAVRLGR